ncbi:MAG: YdcF family protein [Myxococcales bacterium]|nr:YdcF family protein [Myxococcales bacterium]
MLHRWLRRILASLAVWAGVHLLAISVDGCTDEGADADLAVVLGNQVGRDGVPSPRLQRRLERALELWRAGKVARVIVSGGQDPGSPHEADVMRAWLIDRGVPAGLVVADRDGVNTHATARFTRDYMQAHGLTSVVAVSQFYHLSRCKLALRMFGAPGVSAAHAALEFEARDPWSMLRELVGYYAYLGEDYGAPTPP